MERNQETDWQAALISQGVKQSIIYGAKQWCCRETARDTMDCYTQMATAQLGEGASQEAIEEGVGQLAAKRTKRTSVYIASTSLEEGGGQSAVGMVADGTLDVGEACAKAGCSSVATLGVGIVCQVGEYAGDHLGETIVKDCGGGKTAQEAGEAVGGLAGSVATGAIVGSVVPGVGTAIGATIGAIGWGVGTAIHGLCSIFGW